MNVSQKKIFFFTLELNTFNSLTVTDKRITTAHIMHAFPPISLLPPPVACWVLKKGAKGSAEEGMRYLNGLVCRQGLVDYDKIRQADGKEAEGDKSKQH